MAQMLQRRKQATEKRLSGPDLYKTPDMKTSSQTFHDSKEAIPLNISSAFNFLSWGWRVSVSYQFISWDELQQIEARETNVFFQDPARDGSFHID